MMSRVSGGCRDSDREPADQQIEQGTHEQGDADESVDLEERAVQTGQVVRLHDGVLVEERARDDQQAQPEERARVGGDGVPGEQGGGDGVAATRPQIAAGIPKRAGTDMTPISRSVSTSWQA